VAARAVTTRDVADWTVVAGNPARKVGDRDRNARDSYGPGRRT
jgi:acetyltransferase-like isoleucine patch superfamily enzyme